MITFTTPKHHWNYFLAIEQDLEKVSRYIEFANDNLNVHSIELTHILLSASSEVDVIMKEICQHLEPSKSPNNINDYKSIVISKLSQLVDEQVIISRFGLTFKPWENWKGASNPDWWRSYNNVKHQRNSHFNEANLQNTINSVGALLISVIYYYQLAFSSEVGHQIEMRDTTRQLEPESTFIKIDNDDHYYHSLIIP